MNSEEYVPTTTPISNAKVNPRITSPPKRKMDSKTKNVLNDVLNVRLRVLVNDRFMISERTSFL